MEGISSRMPCPSVIKSGAIKSAGVNIVSATIERMAHDALGRKGEGGKTIVVDASARYYGAALALDSLVTPD